MDRTTIGLIATLLTVLVMLFSTSYLHNEIGLPTTWANLGGVGLGIIFALLILPLAHFAIYRRAKHHERC